MRFIKVILLNGLILTITAFIIRCITMFFNVYISQKIGAEAVGIFGLIMSVYGFAITIALSGINLATTKIIAEEIAIGNARNIKKVVRKCLIFSIFFSSIASILLTVFAPFICKYCLHSKVSSNLFYIISISLPFISMSSCLTGYFAAIRNTIKPASNQILEQLLKVWLISVFLNYFMPCGINYICLSMILGNIISEIISFIYIYFLYKLENKGTNSYEKINNNFEKRILNITLPIGLTSFIRSGLSTLKQICIPLCFEKFGNTCEQALANYGLISGMAMPLIMFPNIIVLTFSNLLIPELASFCVNSKFKSIKRITKKMIKFTMFFSVCIAVFLFIFSNKLGSLIYKSNSVSLYIKLLVPLIPIMYLDNVIDAVLKGLDKQVDVLKINVLDLIFSIILLFWLIPKFGVIGYIFTIYCSELLNFLLSYRTLKSNNI